jgi:hypothetical protein
MTDDAKLEQIAERQDALYQQIRSAIADIRGLGLPEEMSVAESDALDIETDDLLEMVASPELSRLIAQWQALERQHEAMVARSE